MEGMSYLPRGDDPHRRLLRLPCRRGVGRVVTKSWWWNNNKQEMSLENHGTWCEIMEHHYENPGTLASWKPMDTLFSLRSSPRESGGAASAGRISALGSDEALTVNKMMATWMCNGRNNLETSLVRFRREFYFNRLRNWGRWGDGAMPWSSRVGSSDLFPSNWSGFR